MIPFINVVKRAVMIAQVGNKPTLRFNGPKKGLLSILAIRKINLERK
jgi:hypothetical protein